MPNEEAGEYNNTVITFRFIMHPIYIELNSVALCLHPPCLLYLHTSASCVCVYKDLMEVFCLRSNVTADAADVHQGSAAAAAVACVTSCLLSECQAEGGAAAEVLLRKGQGVTSPSFSSEES